jgi:hypothetical protein
MLEDVQASPFSSELLACIRSKQTSQFVQISKEKYVKVKRFQQTACEREYLGQYVTLKAVYFHDGMHLYNNF